MHKIAEKKWSEKIFKAYDIRGVYLEEINEDAAYKIGRAYADYIHLSKNEPQKITILVSFDARSSSPSLKAAFVNGLLAEGADVIDAGLTTTPMHYYAVNVSGADGGAMITASHNPAKFNGIKLTRKMAVPIGEGTGMEEIKNSALRGIFSEKETGVSVKKDYLDEYLDFFAEKFSRLKPFSMRLTACAANGMTSILLKKLFDKFPQMEVQYLHNELDMTFPNHEANPLNYDNLKDVQEEVRKNDSSLGISFDGDGDRVGFVDEKGKIIPGDIITALLVRYFAEGQAVTDGNHNANPDKIVYDLRSSRVIREEAGKYGMRLVEGRVGHVFMKALMKKENAVFGGEVSGHYYFRDFFFCESGVFAALAIIDLLCVKKRPISELIAGLSKYYKTEEINFVIKNKDLVLDKVASCFPDAMVSYLDGIKVEYDDWWFSLRLSNTEDLVRLNLEASSSRLLEEKNKLITELVTKFG
ncbi:phosphomannomutase/phosphoglucomutase [Candidatus Giovannonibacteria bacterium]|nr:phosphomannomutase/phosphoglucomutase [Candidatus Giovannonibacteria bacterium]